MADAVSVEDLARLEPYKGQRNALRDEWPEGFRVLYYHPEINGNGTLGNEWLGYATQGDACTSVWRRMGLRPNGNNARRNAVKHVYSGPSATPQEAYAALTSPTLSPLAAELLAFLQKHRAGVHSMGSLSQHFDRSIHSIGAALDELRAAHYDVPWIGDSETGGVAFAPPAIATTDEPVPMPSLRKSEIVAGVVSDTHLSSKFYAQDELEETYDLFAQEGVEDVFHPGDLTGGPGIVGYNGHLWETLHECEGPAGTVDYAIKHYPLRPGMTTHFVEGNHDDWWRQKHGNDLLEEICAARPDLHCLGRDVANLRIGPDLRTRVRLLHPDGGSAYALSYRPQKIVEGLLGGTKPHVLFIGHFHRAGWFFLRNVHALLCGCFEWQTPFLARKGIEPVVGAYILHLQLDPDGWVREFGWRFLPYYYKGDD